MSEWRRLSADNPMSVGPGQTLEMRNLYDGYRLHVEVRLKEAVEHLCDAVQREPRCRNCKHWGDPKLAASGPPDVRGCNKVDADTDGAPATTRSSADFGYESSSWLDTKADFGCVLFEKREGE